LVKETQIIHNQTRAHTSLYFVLFSVKDGKQYIVAGIYSYHHYMQKKPARSFNFTFCYIDDVLSLNNSRFGDFVDNIYPIELEIKDTTDS
jgi:hypothetical protein